MLSMMCLIADKVVIGVGSANKHDVRNPWSWKESAEMIGESLHRFSNFQIMPIDDVGDGNKWGEMVAEKMGDLDAFVSGNAYTTGCMVDHYHVMHPTEIIDKQLFERNFLVSSTDIRLSMAEGNDIWKLHTPVAESITFYGWVDRFVKEFGEETLKRWSVGGDDNFSDVMLEMKYTMENLDEIS